MEKCRVKMTESYPAGCKGWRRERLNGCLRCETCKYFSENYDEYNSSYNEFSSSNEENHYNQKKEEQQTILFGTWARQFLPKLTLDELE